MCTLVANVWALVSRNVMQLEFVNGRKSWEEPWTPAWLVRRAVWLLGRPAKTCRDFRRGRVASGDLTVLYEATGSPSGSGWCCEREEDVWLPFGVCPARRRRRQSRLGIARYVNQHFHFKTHKHLFVRTRRSGRADVQVMIVGDLHARTFPYAFTNDHFSPPFRAVLYP